MSPQWRPGLPATMRVDPERTLTRPPKRAGMVALARRVGQDGRVQTAYENGTGPARPAWRATPRPPLVRQRQGKVIAGVAAGLAEHLGVPVVAVRVVLVLTSIPFGAGLAVYVFLWATMREVGDVDPAIASTLSPAPGAPVADPATARSTTSTSPPCAPGCAAETRPSSSRCSAWPPWPSPARSGSAAPVSTSTP